MEQQTKQLPELELRFPEAFNYKLIQKGSGLEIAMINGTFADFQLSEDHEEMYKGYANLFVNAPTTAAERDSLKEEVKGLEAQLRASKHDTGIFKGERDKLKEEVENCRQDISMFKKAMVVEQQISKERADTIDGLRDNIRRFLNERETTAVEISKLKEENERLKVDRDEKEVMINAFDKIRKLFDSYEWIKQGRGPYAYNDEGYRKEITNLYNEFEAIKDDTWQNIKTKTFEYKQALTAELRDINKSLVEALKDCIKSDQVEGFIIDEVRLRSIDLINQAKALNT